MTHTDHLGKFTTLFVSYLLSFFAQKRKGLKNFSPVILEAENQIERLTLSGGKRIRPALIYYPYQALSSGPLDSVKNYCLSIEMLHSFALIHDDIMDRGKTRRANETAIAYFAKKYKDDHLANSLAILTGDLAFSWADELFSLALTQNKINYQRLFNIYAALKNEVVYGQLMDIKKVKTEKEILQMMQFKTASYSFEKPLLLGAVLGGASSLQLKLLSSFGQNIGLAFQIQDDILGVFGDAQKLGKPVGSDLKEGKMNLLSIKTLTNLNGVDKKAFLQIWGNPRSNFQDLVFIRDLMKRSGSLSDCFNFYKKLKTDALKTLFTKTLPKKLTKLLAQLTDEILILHNIA